MTEGSLGTCEFPGCTAQATETFGTDFTPVCRPHNNFGKRMDGGSFQESSDYRKSENTPKSETSPLYGKHETRSEAKTKWLLEQRKSETGQVGQIGQLPEPECSHGYTKQQLAEILGQRLQDFYKWGNGSTVVDCTGQQCGVAHGLVTFRIDLELFLEGANG